MSVRKIGLVHRAPASFPSGGDLYNQQLLHHSAGSGFPLHSLHWRAEGLPEGNWDLLVWDSLLLDRVTRIAKERVALLLHYLPSLDPALDCEGRAALQTLENRAIDQADAVIVTGRFVAEVIAKRWPDKPVFLSEPGVGTAFSAPSTAYRADGRVELLTVAHLLPAKGHCYLLRILGQLGHRDWHWNVVGDACRSPVTTRCLRKLAKQAGLEERLSFHGALSQRDVASLMADSDLFVFPSTFESYSMVLAEATAAGLPVLSNRVGAAEQLIRHGVTGFLVPSGDWNGFAQYLCKLLDDRALRAAFRENLRHIPVRRWNDTVMDFRSACEAMFTV